MCKYNVARLTYLLDEVVDAFEKFPLLAPMGFGPLELLPDCGHLLTESRPARSLCHRQYFNLTGVTCGGRQH